MKEKYMTSLTLTPDDKKKFDSLNKEYSIIEIFRRGLEVCIKEVTGGKEFTGGKDNEDRS
jgi:hypothetical protein